MTEPRLDDPATAHLVNRRWWRVMGARMRRSRTGQRIRLLRMRAVIWALGSLGEECHERRLEADALARYIPRIR